VSVVLGVVSTRGGAAVLPLGDEGAVDGKLPFATGGTAGGATGELGSVGFISGAPVTTVLDVSREVEVAVVVDGS